MAAKRPLKEMRKLLHTGERMPVQMDCAAELKQCIRRREWDERASKALSSKGSLSTAQVCVLVCDTVLRLKRLKATVDPLFPFLRC